VKAASRGTKLGGRAAGGNWIRRWCVQARAAWEDENPMGGAYSSTTRSEDEGGAGRLLVEKA
jgi:hypothetical protein